MLAAQMATVHMATMTFARRLKHVDTIPQQDSAERAFNKLARTFTTQMEALKRYRTGGEAGSGAPPGNKNAVKHGLYTSEAIAQRRQLAELMRQSRKLLSKIE